MASSRRRRSLGLALGLGLVAATAAGIAAGGCGRGTGTTPAAGEAEALLRRRLAGLPSIEIPVVRAEGVYGTPFVRAAVEEAQSAAEVARSGQQAQVLSLFYGQLDNHLRAAREMLAALEAQEGDSTGAPGSGRPASPASTSLALEEAHTALANAEAIVAYCHLNDVGPQAFRLEVQAGLSTARDGLAQRRELAVAAERVETSLSRYFHLPVLELALEGAQSQVRQAQQCLDGSEGSGQERLFLAASNLAMARHELGLFDYLWQRRSQAPATPALDGPVSARLPALDACAAGPEPPGETCPFLPDTQAYRRWQDSQGYVTAAADQAARGCGALALGEALNARAAREVAPWLKPVRIGPPPAGGCGCDLAGMRRLVAQNVASGRDRVLRLEEGGLTLPWLWTSLSSVGAAMGSADLQLEAALKAEAADLPTLEQTLALAYADSLVRSLRCLYVLDVVESLGAPSP